MTLFAKLWVDVLGDEKLMRAARKGAKELRLLPWLIAFAKRADDDGRLTVNDEPAEPIDIAQLIPNATPRAVAAACSELETLGILVRHDDDALAFTNWGKRAGRKQGEDPDAVLDRVHRRREKRRRERKETPPVTVGVTASETATVTLSSSRERARESIEQEKREEKRELEQRAESRARPPRDEPEKPLAAASSAIAGVIGEPSAALVLVSAANLGIAKRWGEQPSPILPTSGATFEAVDELARNGVPVSFARDAIYTWCMQGAGVTSDGRPPRSLRYFVGYVTDRWTQSRALAAASMSGAQLLPPDPTTGDDRFGSDDFSRQLARGVELEKAKDAAIAARSAHG